MLSEDEPKPQALGRKVTGTETLEQVVMGLTIAIVILRKNTSRGLRRRVNSWDTLRNVV